jgi:hypothetical protein
MEIKGEPDFRYCHTGPNRVAFLSAANIASI